MIDETTGGVSDADETKVMNAVTADAAMTEKTPPTRIPKLLGFDAECGNFILGGRVAGARTATYERGYNEKWGSVGYVGGSDSDAASALLSQIEGVRTRLAEARDKRLRKKAAKMAKKRSKAHGDDHSYGMWYRDYGRKWLSNGGCAYIDCQKLELCTPIVRSALDHVKYLHAMYGIARHATELARANGKDVCLLLNNTDGHGSSWGTHLNVLVTRQCWENIFHRKLQYLMYLAAYQVSSIIFTGQGKVGGEDGTSWVDYQISQRADYFKVMVGEQTTYNRPIVNSRDESLCGDSYTNKTSGLARLHCIFYDQNLCHVSSYLKVGVMQIIMAMIEAEFMDPNLLLDDPLMDVRVVSRDPSMKVTIKTAGGRELTAVEHQFGFLDAAKRFAAEGGLDGVVPGYEHIMETWESTLRLLQAGDFESLAGRLDWVLKKFIIEKAMAEGDFGWNSPQAKMLDHKYSDVMDGLYFTYEDAVAERLISKEDIEVAMFSPPEDTRSWFVGKMLSMAEDGEIEVDDVDWHEIELTVPKEGADFAADEKDKSKTFNGELDLGNPLSYTRKMCQAVLDGDGTLLQRLARLGMKEKTWSYRSSYSGGKTTYSPHGGGGAHYADFDGVDFSDETYEREKGRDGFHGSGGGWQGH